MIFIGERTNYPSGSIRKRYNCETNCFEMQMACELESDNIVWLGMPDVPAAEIFAKLALSLEQE